MSKLRVIQNDKSMHLWYIPKGGDGVSLGYMATRVGTNVDTLGTYYAVYNQCLDYLGAVAGISTQC